MVSLEPQFDAFLQNLPPSPIDQTDLVDLVQKAYEACKHRFNEAGRVQWEFYLKRDIYALAETEGRILQKDEARYYDSLRDKLDVILIFSESGACDNSFPFLVLQDLLETQTIASCSHIFTWIEARASRLTVGMVPQKGKALILLRTLNDLLRRLSKTGSSTVFCGRILTFLSGVFTLGERSGVNLRGEYGATWEGVRYSNTKLEQESKPSLDPQGSSVKEEEENKMQVDNSPESPAGGKEDFYNTFWSLQLPFSKPTIFSAKDAFTDFKAAVLKVLPVIKEATAKDRLMMGSRGLAGQLKRKRELEEETNTNLYFFAKFLTSPELLELEIADTHFRRQFLFQLLVLLHHISTFTKASKEVWANGRNRSLQMEFTLDEEDAQWVQDIIGKVVDEMRQTTPNGHAFADTVTAIMEREKNWVKWKSDLCTAFDKGPWKAEVDGKALNFMEATEPLRAKELPRPWEWSHGSEALSNIWKSGYTGLEDLQFPFHPGRLSDFVKKLKLEDIRIERKRQKLRKLAAPTPAMTIGSDLKTESTTIAAPRPMSMSVASSLHPSLPAKPGTPTPPKTEGSKPIPTSGAGPSTPTPARVETPNPPPAPALIVDPEISACEENKKSIAWLAFRMARDQHLQFFGRAGTGDIEELAYALEHPDEEKKTKGEENTGGVINEEHGNGSPSSSTQTGEGGEVGQKVPEDVKMEG